VAVIASVEEQRIWEMEAVVLHDLEWRMVAVTVSDFVVNMVAHLEVSCSLPLHLVPKAIHRADIIIHAILPGLFSSTHKTLKLRRTMRHSRKKDFLLRCSFMNLHQSGWWLISPGCHLDDLFFSLNIPLVIVCYSLFSHPLISQYYCGRDSTTHFANGVLTQMRVKQICQLKWNSVKSIDQKILNEFSTIT
jgi:hypothetical protein